MSESRFKCVNPEIRKSLYCRGVILGEPVPDAGCDETGGRCAAYAGEGVLKDNAL